MTFSLPRAWRLIGLLLLGSLIVTLAFLLLASYSRVETVQGTIVPDRGIAEIRPVRAGLVASVLVQDGARVRAGDRLVVVRAAETTSQGSSVRDALGSALARQDRGLETQLAESRAAGLAEQLRIDEQVSGLGHELRELAEQISVQRQMVESARRELENARGVAARGFISRRDLQVREDSYLTRRQQLSQLTQAQAAKAATLREARRAGSEAAARSRSQSASIEASRADLAQRRIDADVGGTHVLTAPFDGVVTALAATPGQTVTPQQTIMAVVPANSRFTAELAVPTRAAGFIERGQDVRLAIDAFPYQRFGTVRGTIERVATAATNRRSPSGVDEPVYLVTVSLTEPAVRARGRMYPLVSGMTLSARIVTQRQSLFEWLFEPIFSAASR